MIKKKEKAVVQPPSYVVFVFGDERLSFETVRKQHSLYFRFQPKDLIDVPEHHSANKNESPRNIFGQSMSLDLG